LASSEVAFTIDEAATFLDPPITRDQLAGLIAALGIRPVGKRRQPGRGRPALTYEVAELMRLHAAVVPWLAVSSAPSHVDAGRSPRVAGGEGNRTGSGRA
jgi:hypothetical protein